MSYAKIDDLLPHHSKVLMAGRHAPAVFGLYVASICYAQRHWTDGAIPRTALSLLLPGCPRPSRGLIAQLVWLRLWDETEGGWQVHDYLEHNLSAEERRAQNAGTAARVSKYRDRLRNAVSNAVSNVDGNAAVSSTTPLLSSPLFSAPKVKPSESGLGARTLPDGFSANLPATAKTAATRYPTTEAEYLASRGGGHHE